MTRTVHLLLLCCAAARLADAQSGSGASGEPTMVDMRSQAPQPIIGKGTIAGTVVDSKTHQPVKKARISLNGAAQLSAVTDSAGSFAFHALPPGGYFVMVNHDLYSNDPTSMTQNVNLADGEEKRDVEIRLVPGTSISGQVVDEDNSPVGNCQVRVMQFNSTSGRRRLMTSNGTSTDDEGRYRITGIMPAHYAMKVQCSETFPAPHGFMARNDPLTPREGYAPVVRNDGIVAAAGSELTGIDFHVKRVPFYAIRGTLSGAPPDLLRGAQVFLESQDAQAGDDMPIPGGYNFGANQFVFQHVPAGSYEVVAATFDQERAYGARLDVEAGKAPVTQVELKLSAGPAVAGSIEIDDPALKLEGMQIALEPLALDYRGPYPAATITKDGTFEFRSILPGSFRLNGLAMGYVKSMTLGSREIQLEHFEVPAEGAAQMHIVLGSKMATVHVTVEPSPKVGEFLTLLLVPSNGAQPVVSGMTTGSGPASTGVTVPPGKYRVLVTAGQSFGLINQPGVIKALESHTAVVEVEEGAEAKVTLAAVPQDDLQKAVDNADE